MSTNELRAKQINVSERLDETRHAIAFLRGMGMDVPDEAIELLHIMERCVAAESRIASEHPPDDDTTADDEWVYGVTRGIKWRLKWDAGTREVFIGDASVGVKKTRGEWRRLLVALGITLKENK